MAKAAIVILAGNESHADYGRLANALEAAKEFAENDDDELELIFDGAGTQWIPELEDEESDYHELYQAVRDDAAVCDYCSGAFGVDEAVADAGLVTLDEYDGHPSIRSLVDDDYEIITFLAARPVKPHSRFYRRSHLASDCRYLRPVVAVAGRDGLITASGHLPT